MIELLTYYVIVSVVFIGAPGVFFFIVFMPALQNTKGRMVGYKDHKMFGDFLDWVKAHNDNVIRQWDEKVAERQNEISDDDANTVEQFIDVELESNEKQ